MTDKKFNLKESLGKLNDIVAWFEEQEEVDVEVGLEKVKEGAKLVIGKKFGFCSGDTAK